MSTYKCENPECGKVFKSNNPLSCPKCDTLEFSTIHIKSNNKIFVIGFLILFIGVGLFYFNYANVYLLRGFVYQKLEKPNEAISNYTKAIYLDNKKFLAYHNRGFIYHELGKYNDAIDDYSNAISLDPVNARAYRNRGIAKHEAGNSNYFIDYEKACELGEIVCCDWH
jgi:tetratricopeptide (TPR) repeat protein